MNKTVGIILILIIVVLSGVLYYQYTELNSIKTENLDLKEKVTAFETAIEIGSESAQTFYEKLNDEIKLPNGEYGYTLEQPLDSSYSIEHVQNEITIISSYLNSFRLLTEQVENTLSVAQKNVIEHLDWAIQNIGFHNRQLRINISVYELDLIIKKLDFEAAINKFRLNEVDETTVEHKEKVYLEAKVNFENYIANVGFAD